MSVRKAAAKSPLSNGQDSIFRLLYAPLAFLSAGNEGALIDMLASAIGFLEGYSTESLEADAVFTRGSEGAFVSRSQLKLVPYRAQPGVPAQLSHHGQLVPQTRVDVATHKSAVIEQRITPPISPPMVTNAEMEALIGCFGRDFLDAGRCFEALLHEPSSLTFTKVAVTCFSQTGLTITSHAFKKMLSRLEQSDTELARKIALDYEFEIDLTAFIDWMPADLAHKPLVTPRVASRQLKTGYEPVKTSRLERIRNGRKPGHPSS